MKKEIKADQKFDKQLDKLVFSDDVDKFQMALIFINSAEKIDLEISINAFMGATRKLLHFETEESSDIAINVIGNIPEALKFLNDDKMISNELYSRIQSESELSDFLTRSGSFVIYKFDKNDLSFLSNSDDEDQKPINTTSKTTPTSQGGFFGESGKKPTTDNVSATPNPTQPDSPYTPPPSVKVK